ncbi:class I adenylate-forming enzyme family protein [Nocardia wallacei]|uniref:class I adenylate-forming enzyme family protein n=1 Tax=Nocardia wallacei TaxID=480035 RepID=UPI002457D166|nr:class I adenylate-forming enzyme family protein [Nocardia wallacei]
MSDWPGAGTILRELTAPGAAFPVVEVESGDRRFRTYRNTARSMREFAQRFGDFGDRRALVSSAGVRSYRELDRDIVSAAHWLRRAGVGHGDRVAILSRNRPEFPVVFWAAQAIGAIFVPFNPWWTAAEIEYGMGDADPEVIFAEADLLEKVDPGRCRVVGMGLAQPSCGVVEWDEVVTFQRLGELPFADVEPDDFATIVYTSGTTGRPKGVVHTHRNHCVSVVNAALTAATIAAARRGSDAALAAEPVVLQVLPWFHVAGLGSMYGSLVGGAVNIIQPRWNAAEALRILAEEKVTTLGAVPTMLAELVAAAADSPSALDSLATLTSGATAVPTTLLRTVADTVGEQVCMATGYGLTETTASVALCVGPDLTDKPDSIGVPFPVNRIRIVDEQMRDVAVGETGEIVVSGPTVAAGYWRSEEATRAAFAAGAFRTGDLGRQDIEGFLSLAGRIKDVIIRGGENIQAAEIENVIAELPGVMTVAVVGLPHPRLGEEVTAVFTLYSDSELTEADIDAHCRRQLASIKVPSRYIRAGAIPRSASGKILKAELLRALAGQGNT